MNNEKITNPEDTSSEAQANAAESLMDDILTDAEVADNQIEAGDDVAEAQAQVAEMRDKYLRLMAEFENFKKRNVRERMELLQTAAKDTMTGLLDVLDDFDRASQTGEGLSEGIQLVYNKLQNTLRQKGLQAMDSNNAAFDADLHEAITEIPAPNEDMKGKVIDTVQKGYFLNDKIIRYAKVVVGK